MFNRLRPCHVFVVAAAARVCRQQQHVIDYLQEENRVLREQLGGRRLRFTDEQRRRLAAEAKLLQRKVLGEDHEVADFNRRIGRSPSDSPFGRPRAAM